MKSLFQRKITSLLVTILLMCGTFVVSTAAQKTKRTRSANIKQLNEAADKSSEAANVVKKIMSELDQAIPSDLLSRAEAVAVFPGVVQAAFIFGGRGGSGVISRRTGAGWSAPAFFNLGGGSFGAQIGGSKTDFVMLFMNDQALKGILADKFEFGGEANAAAGPVGRTAAATTDLKLDAGILTYSRSKGAFIGIALKGVVINPDKELNQAVYGITASDLLSNTGSSPSMAINLDRTVIFPQTLARYSPRR